MKIIVFALVLMVVLGLRNAHKSQYDLGYEAAIQDIMKEVSLNNSRQRRATYGIILETPLLVCGAMYQKVVQETVNGVNGVLSNKSSSIVWGFGVLGFT